MKETCEINFNMDGLKKLEKMIKGVGHVKVGLLGDVAGKGGKKGSDTHSNTSKTNAEIGVVHEFGGTINHPGGTPYIINKSGQAVFVKKGTKGAAGITKAHQIKMPQRSFIKYPIEHEAKKILASLLKNRKKYEQDFKNGNKKILLNQLGIAAEAACIDAFESGGFGQWTPLKKSTIARKAKKGGEPKILVDEGELKGAIASQVVMDE